jgi:hypothetical protein
MRDGLLRDLHASVSSIAEARRSYQQAITTLPE